MSRAVLWLIVAVVAFSAVLFLRYGESSRDDEFMSDPAVGQSMTDLHVVPLTGESAASEPIVLHDLSGKVVLVNLWGTWCGPCVQEAPHIASLQRQLASRADAVVLPISYPAGSLASTEETLDELKQETSAFAIQKGLQMTTYADPTGRTYAALQSLLGKIGFPTNVVLDRRGTVRGVWRGYGPGMEREVERLLRQLVKEG